MRRVQRTRVRCPRESSHSQLDFRQGRGGILPCSRTAFSAISLHVLVFSPLLFLPTEAKNLFAPHHLGHPHTPSHHPSSSHDSLPRGSSDTLPHGTRPVGMTLSLQNSLSPLPGSSFHKHPEFGHHAMSADHARMLHRQTVQRGRRLASQPQDSRRKLQTDTGVEGAYLPLEGNVDPQIAGLYWTELELGDPSRKFRVQVDSGSNLIWVNCQPCPTCGNTPSPPFDPATSSTSSALPCRDTLCSTFQAVESQIEKGCIGGEAEDGKCYYWLVYGDGSTTTGYLLQDRLNYRQLDGDPGTLPITFGCGYNQTGNLASTGQSVDGLLGLGKGGVSLLVQMQQQRLTNEVFAVCLGGEARGGGSLILGAVFAKGAQYTPLYFPNTHYAVWLDGVTVGSQRLPGVDASTFGQTPGGDGRVVLDTGTTLAIVPESVFNLIASSVTAATNLKYANEPDFYCFEYGSIPWEELQQHFPDIILHFEGSDLVLTPTNYMFLKYDTSRRSACLGWTPGQQTILGDIILHDFLVTFDVDNRRLGWAPFDCSGGTIKAEQGNYNVSIVVGMSSRLSSRDLPISTFALSCWFLAFLVLLVRN